MSKIAHSILQRVALNLPLRIIDHNGRPYLRRYYLCTVFGIRFYLHHFVDSDPVGLHNHPAKLSLSLFLSNIYQEERRWCEMPNQRTIRWFNLLTSDSMHRVLLFRDGAGNPLTVWTLFGHTRKVMPWGTLKDKGAFVQYYEEFGENEVVDGHSQWHLKAKKGWQLLNDDGTLRSVPL